MGASSVGVGGRAEALHLLTRGLAALGLEQFSSIPGLPTTQLSSL